MIREICQVMGISMQLRKITNYSLQHTAITELKITTDRIMPFSDCHTLNGIMLYQIFTSHNIVSLIIPDYNFSKSSDKNSSQVNCNNKKEDHKEKNHDKNNYMQVSCNCNNKNEKEEKSVEEKKKIPLAPLASNIELDSYDPRKKRKIYKIPHDWSKPFK
ncbi:8509_t:CDS:2, partial [Gigaspora rosea]